MKKGIASSVKEVLEDFITLFYPHYCDACHNELVKGEETLCTACILDLPHTGYHKDRFNPLFKRLYGRIQIKYALAFFTFHKNGKVQNLLHALKYRNRPEIGRHLGMVYGEQLKEAGYVEEFDLIVPVPLFKYRQIQRGYNQSEQFAQGLCTSLNVRVEGNLVKRVVKTSTQTRRTKLGRWENVKSVFQLAAPEDVAGKRILLVDDIITTGATVEACGKELLDAGCTELSVACMAVTQ